MLIIVVLTVATTIYWENKKVVNYKKFRSVLFPSEISSVRERIQVTEIIRMFDKNVNYQIINTA